MSLINLNISIRTRLLHLQANEVMFLKGFKVTTVMTII
jgi:hypothetical protein